MTDQSIPGRTLAEHAADPTSPIAGTAPSAPSDPPTVFQEMRALSKPLFTIPIAEETSHDLA